MREEKGKERKEKGRSAGVGRERERERERERLACASSRSLAGASPISRPASWLTTVGLFLFCSVRRLEPVRVEPREQLLVELFGLREETGEGKGGTGQVSKAEAEEEN